MSDFKNQLNSSLISKDTFEHDLEKCFEYIAKQTLDSAVNKTHKSIKNELLIKARSGKYKTINMQKYIVGYMHILDDKYPVSLHGQQKVYWQNIGGDICSKRINIQQAFTQRYPDIEFRDDCDYSDFAFHYAFVKREEKKGFWKGTYYCYNITDFAKNFLQKLKEKASTDDISVDFAYIDVNGAQISDGGNVDLKTGLKSSAIMVIKYTMIL